MDDLPPREVRLRPQFAALYPSLEAGTWVPSSLWAAAIVTRAQEARRGSVHRRTFEPQHFEFRGGAPPRLPAERHLHTRAEDS